MDMIGEILIKHPVISGIFLGALGAIVLMIVHDILKVRERRMNVPYVPWTSKWSWCSETDENIKNGAFHVQIDIWRSDWGVLGYRHHYYDGDWYCIGFGKLLHISWGPK